jgi:hypothetical protein
MENATLLRSEALRVQFGIKISVVLSFIAQCDTAVQSNSTRNISGDGRGEGKVL